MRAGETIDVVNTDVSIYRYSATPSGEEYEFFTPVPLTFSSLDYNGDFSFQQWQGLDESPTMFIFLTGVITTNTGRTINIDIVDGADTIGISGSSKNSCTLYIPTVNKSWRLINQNPSTYINWKALASTGGSIIGGTLSPGAVVSSITYYGGTYPCIKENTLTFSAGGAVDYQSC